MLFRILFWALIIYFAYRAITNFINPPQQRNNVGSRNEQEPKIDLKDADIEDVTYREIKNDKKKDN